MITSLENKTIKLMRKLQQKKYRTEYNLFVIEGIHLVQEAVQAGRVEHILFDSRFALEGDQLYFGTTFVVTVPKNVQVDLIDDSFTKKISTTQSPQGIFALVRIVYTPIEEMRNKRVLILDGLQDPGNVGTLIRTAAAFAYEMIVFTSDAVDPHNDKLLRATQGVFFTQAICQVPASEIAAMLHACQMEVFVLDFGGVSVDTAIPKSTSYAMIAGREGSGIRLENWQNVNFEKITIPMREDVESLNVTIATSIAMYALNKH